MVVMSNEFVVLIYSSKGEYCSISIYLPSDGLTLRGKNLLSFFIRPFEKRSYYVIPPGVCPSVRPSVRPSVNFFVSV